MDQNFPPQTPIKFDNDSVELIGDTLSHLLPVAGEDLYNDFVSCFGDGRYPTKPDDQYKAQYYIFVALIKWRHKHYFIPIVHSRIRKAYENLLLELGELHRIRFSKDGNNGKNNHSVLNAGFIELMLRFYCIERPDIVGEQGNIRYHEEQRLHWNKMEAFIIESNAGMWVISFDEKFLFGNYKPKSL